jgi:hypothetical protein
MGNRLLNAVNVSVRKTFRRAATGKPQSNGNGHTTAQNGHTDGMEVDENTPLISRAHNDPFWRSFFFDRKKTPGTDNESPLIRFPALAWNVFKVTLLSCTYMRRG